MLYTFDNQFYDKYNIVAGLDEAGRGPLAGPVCAAVVILPKDEVIQGVADSKKLTPKKRDLLYDEIISKAVDYSVAYASSEEIDEINILQATYLAMRRAFDGMSVKPDFLLIDGNGDPEISVSRLTVVKGDSTSASIAAASILAKVSRDRYIIEQSEIYPQYEFARHKGYGTKLHYEMLDKYGPCALHRASFLKKWEAKNAKS